MPFEVGGVVGRGGMGVVRTAHDPRLGRDVALKTVAPGDPTSAARLAREAVITARLEHPGIMPIYAAGRDPSGRPWYAMRYFDGRSLAGAIAAAPALVDRLRLVRHVLDASEAVAYAHAQGVLHRDLKPANVMTGRFGETLVADWGLACTLDEAAVETEGSVGTPGYMSPEQEAGRSLDERADVYGLGAMLFEVLSGAAPGQGPIQDGPPELQAVVTRAMHPELADRYRSARAFADDLLAWFEGRRVSAHEYSAMDAIRRLLRAWRVPLRVAAVALAVLAVVSGAAWWRAAEARVRAEASEAAAGVAREAETTAFAAALRAQAGVALERGLTLEARLLAAEALARREDADARGSLAAVYGRHTLDRVRGAAVEPGCFRRALSPSGARAACISAEGLRFIDGASGNTLARASVVPARLQLPDDEHVVAIDLEGGVWVWTPPAEPVHVDTVPARAGEIGPSLQPGFVTATRDVSEVIIDLAAGTAVNSQGCIGGVVRTTATEADGALLVGCHDRRILRVRGETRQLLTTLAPDASAPVRLAASPDGRIFVGTYNGLCFVLDHEGHEVARHRLGQDAVWSAAWGGDRVFVDIADGTQVLWNTHEDTVEAVLAGHFVDVAWLAPDRVRVFGAELSDRVVPPLTWPHRYNVGSGISAVAISPDATRVATSQGDGRTTLLDPGTGKVQALLYGGSSVAKDVTFSPDGAEVVVAMAGNDLVRYAASDGRRLASAAAGGRRVVWVDGLGPTLAGYGRVLLNWPDIGKAMKVRWGRGFTDLEVSADRRHVAALGRDDSLWLGVPAAGALSWRFVQQFPVLTGVAALGDDALITTTDELLELDADARVRWRLPLPSQPCAIQASQDGNLVAIGFLDGSTGIWRRGGSAPIARLLGHHARLGGIAFSADGRWIATAAWDGELRWWSATALFVDPVATVAQLQAASGVTLDEALATLVHAP